MARRDVVIHGQGAAPRWAQEETGPAFPDATTTGPAAAGYRNLTAYTGPMTVGNGVVIAGKVITGTLTLNGSATVQGCEVRGTLEVRNDPAAPRVLDCLFVSTSNPGPDHFIWTPGSSHLEVARSEFRGCGSDVLKLGGGDYWIHDNFIHANTPGVDGMHVDLIETWADCDGLRIEHNTLLYPHGTSNTTTCIMLSPGSTERYVNAVIDRNLIGGCTYMLYPFGAGPQSAQPASNCRVTNNHFTTLLAGPSNAVAYSSPNVVMNWAANGNAWSGNVWHDGPRAGQPVTPND